MERSDPAAKERDQSGSAARMEGSDPAAKERDHRCRGTDGVSGSTAGRLSHTLRPDNRPHTS